jgi:T4 superinfection immunity protein
VWDSPVHLAIVLFVLSIFCVAYFIPSVIAFSIRKANRFAILGLNLFLGWTVVGWIVAIVWVMKTDSMTPPTNS